MIDCGKWIVEAGTESIYFDSNASLDEYVKNQIENGDIIFSDDLSDVDMTLSVNGMGSTVSKLNANKLNSSVKEEIIEVAPGEFERSASMKNSISVTRLITELNVQKTVNGVIAETAPLVTPMDSESWKNTIVPELSTSLGVPESDVRKAVKQKEDNWPKLTDYGNQIHYIFENILGITDEEFDRINDPSTDEFKEFFTKFKSEFSKQPLNETQFINTIGLVKDLKSKFHQKFNGEYTVISEYSIKSSALKQIYKKSMDSSFTGVNGRIDIMVVDKDGGLHVYDLKVSRKSVGDFNQTSNEIISKNEYSSTKKLTIKYQLALYNVMLEQMGYNVKEVGVIPIKIGVNYEAPQDGPLKDFNSDSVITGVNSVTFDNSAVIINPQGPNKGQRQYDAINELFESPIVYDFINSDISSELDSEFGKLFPSISTSQTTDLTSRLLSTDNEKTIRKQISEVVDQADKDKKGKYRIFFDGEWKYGNSIDDLRDLAIRKIEANNTRRLWSLSRLGFTLQNMMTDGSDEKYMDGGHDINDFMSRNFGYYVKNKWELVQNEDLYNMGVYVFKNNGIVDIVNISTSDLIESVKLPKGTTIFGEFVDDDNVDKYRNELKANSGNINIMKMVMLLNLYPEMLSDNDKLGTIFTLNPWNTQSTSISGEEAIGKFSELVDISNYYNDEKINVNNIPVTDIYTNTVTRVVGIIEEHYSGPIRLNVDKYDLHESDTGNDQIKKLEDLSQEIYKRFDGDPTDLNNPMHRSYLEVLRTVAELKGYRIRSERDTSPYVGFKGGMHVGSHITSLNYSDSESLQTLFATFSAINQKLLEEKNKFVAPVRDMLRKFFKESGVMRAVGGERNIYYKKFFRMDGNKLDPRFILKNPETASDLTNSEKEILTMFLEKFASLKWGNNESKIRAAKESEEYYLVPLKRGNFASRTKTKGVVGAIKGAKEEFGNYLDVDVDRIDIKRSVEKGQTKVYNPYDTTLLDRAERLQKIGVDDFEIDLELVLLDITDKTINKVVLDKYLPIIQGVKSGIMLSSFLNNDANPETVNLAQKYITLNVFDEQIMNEGLLVVHKYTGALRQFVTGLTLGFNFKSGFKEILQGVVANVSRSSVLQFGKEMFNKKDLFWALGYITTDAKNINKISILDHLNGNYGFANAEGKDLAASMRANQYGLLNANSDLMYYFVKAPDMFHRLSLLLAKMRADGSWSAHKMVDGELVYDWTKDERFSIYAKGDKSNPKYLYQEALYMRFVEEFNRDMGYDLKIGDALPRAYTVEEVQGIKSFSEFCFGHYDKHSQMLLKQQFLGTLFFHFRTYFSAKAEQWILKPGRYDQGKYKHQEDENGKKLYYAYIIDGNQNMEKVLINEDDPRMNDSSIEKKAIVRFKSTPLEGIAYSVLKMLKAVSKLDVKKTKELWDNPTVRGNMKLFFHDMFILALLAMIVTMIFSEDGEVKKESWGKMVSYNMLMNSFNDFNLGTIVSGMFGDWTPPSQTMIVDFLNNTAKLITGDPDGSRLATLANYFGVTRDFKHIISD